MKVRTMSSRYEDIEDLFHSARMLDPADRASFLDDRCAEDLDLRTEVESLLMHADRTTGAMVSIGSADVSPMTLTDRGPLAEGPGTRIGPYKILQQIGEGGFGTVYMAEQQFPVERRVALKIIKLGMDTKQVIARFEAERQALALMEHPNIARVLDVGATETGRPYFAMELIKGIPLAEYCDRANLPIRERLELFMQVCRAVQHAHQKGIIHRDLKPNNVLVTLHDSVPVPKIIDFGIAKATSRRLTEHTLFTEFRQFIGTPEYMSPDQAEISGLDVDTRTDIYSLGVILYELITGTTPFDTQTLRDAGYEEVQRIIREVEPPKPSTRLVTLVGKGTGDAIARHRDSEPISLTRLTKGDLDWIVMKALEKDRTRRYQTANDLADDVQRHLANEPVSAGPPSASYKLRKFVRRHRKGVMAALVVVMALGAGLAVASVGFVEARREAQRSQQIADFLQNLFISTDGTLTLAGDIDIDRVVATARRVFGDDHGTVAATLSSRALQLQSAGDLESAEKLYNESLSIWRESYGDNNINVGSTLRSLGILQMTKGDNTAAEEALREAIRITRSLPEGETLTLADTLSLLGSTLTHRGEFDEAVQLFQESIELRRRLAPHQRLQIALAVNSLANALVISGKDDALGAVIEEVLTSWREALPPNNLLLARVLIQTGIYSLDHDQNDKAAELFQEAVEIFRAIPNAPEALHAQALRGLAVTHEHRDDLAVAITLIREEAQIHKRSAAASRLETAYRHLADLCWDVAKDPDRRAEVYEIALAPIESRVEDEPDNLRADATRGMLYYRLGRFEDALTALTLVDERNSQVGGLGQPSGIAFIAMTHQQLGHTKEAQDALDRLQSLMQDQVLAGNADNATFLAEAESLISPAPISTGPGG